jgi:hypothetical protein
MPGFNIANIGGNNFGANAPSHIMETRRSYRWYFETLGRGAGNWTAKELLVLQKAKRPSFKYSELTMDHQQEKVYYAGKQEWESISLTWYDIEQDPNISAGLYAWLETVCNLKSIQVNHPKNYKTNATLKLVNGIGTVNETWNMYGCWPVTFNWQELDYSNDAILTCEATMRYDRAIRVCFNPQVPGPVAPNCPVSS